MTSPVNGRTELSQWRNAGPVLRVFDADGKSVDADPHALTFTGLCLAEKRKG